MASTEQSEFPTGTLTFLLTDVEGSTQFLESHSSDAAKPSSVTASDWELGGELTGGFQGPG